MKNRKKNKYIVYGVIALSTLSLVGVGFAAWNIDGSLDDKTSVTVSVGDLTNKTLIVEIKDSDLNIAFDNVETGGTNISNGDRKKEDLSFTVNFRLESSRTINDANTFIITASFDSESESIRKYQELDTAEYIVADCLTDFSFNLPPTSTDSLTTISSYITGKIKYDLDFKGALVSLTYNFAWGSKFNGVNPGLWEGNILTIGERLEDFTAKAKGLLPIDLTITPSYDDRSNK